MSASTNHQVPRIHRAGAPLIPPAISYVVLTVLGVALPSVIAGVRPWTSDAALLDFFQHHSGAAHAGAFFTLGARDPATRVRRGFHDAAAQAHVADSDAAVRVLYGVTFAAGGPAYVVFSGLLLAGVSISGLIGRVLPRALAWFGIVIALVDTWLPPGRIG